MLKAMQKQMMEMMKDPKKMEEMMGEMGDMEGMESLTSSNNTFIGGTSELITPCAIENRPCI